MHRKTRERIEKTGLVGAEITSQPSQTQAGLLSRQQVAQRRGCCIHTVARRKDLKPLRFNRRLLRYRLEGVLAIEAAAQM